MDRPQVHGAGAGAGENGVIPVAVGRPKIERIDQEIDDDADGIAGIGRPKQRQYHIGAFRHSPNRQGLAEVLVMAFHAHIGGDIVQPQDADGGIDHEPGRRGEGPVQFPLQDIVEEDHRRAQVIERVVDPVLEGELDRALATAARFMVNSNSGNTT